MRSAPQLSKDSLSGDPGMPTPVHARGRQTGASTGGLAVQQKFDQGFVEGLSLLDVG